MLDFFCVEDLFDQMCTSMCQGKSIYKRTLLAKLTLMTDIISIGIRDQRSINPDNVLSDTAILLHRREGRKEAAGCGTKGCARKFHSRQTPRCKGDAMGYVNDFHTAGD